MKQVADEYFDRDAYIQAGKLYMLIGDKLPTASVVDEPDYKFRLAKCYEKNGYFQQALLGYKELTMSNCGDFTKLAKEGLTSVLVQQGEGVAICQKLLDEAKEYYRKGEQLDKALEICKNVIDKNPESEYAGAARLLTAAVCLSQGKGEVATGELRDIIGRFPGNELGAKAQFLTAYCCMRDADFVQAGVEYEKLINDFPKSPYVEQGKRMLERTKRYLSEKAAVLYPQSPLQTEARVRAGFEKAAYAEEEPVSKLNLLLISIDTLRGDHVSCLGYGRPTSPNIDKLASQGCLFTNCVSSSNWTIPAHMSMLTSLYPVIHGVTGYENKLDDGRITLAEVLKENGYVTGAFVSGGGRELQAEHGFDQGFNYYDDFTVYFDQIFNLFEENESLQGPNDDVTCPIVHRIATRWLRKNYQKKFFMFVHLWDVHNDYIPPAPYDTMFDPDYKGKMTGRFADIEKISPGIDPKDLNHVMSLYDGEIRYVDEWVGKILGELDSLGITDNTLVVLTADHGEEFNEHGGHHHGRTLYEESTHVPLILKLPAKISQGKVIKSQVSVVDIVPTVVQILGVKADVKEWQGENLLSLINGESDNRHSQVFIESQSGEKNLRAMRTGDFKFVYDFQSQKKELYNLSEDPREKSNLAEAQAQEAKELEGKLMAWLQSSGQLEKSLVKSAEPGTVALDEDRRKRLKALGYLE